MIIEKKILSKIKIQIIKIFEKKWAEKISGKQFWNKNLGENFLNRY